MRYGRPLNYLFFFLLICLCSSCAKDASTDPKIPTDKIAIEITNTSAEETFAQIQFQYQADSLTRVSEIGICWSEQKGPTIGNKKAVITIPGSGDYSLKMTALKPNTRYYVRAYALKEDQRTVFSKEVTVTTKGDTIVPPVPAEEYYIDFLLNGVPKKITSDTIQPYIYYDRVESALGLFGLNGIAIFPKSGMFKSEAEFLSLLNQKLPLINETQAIPAAAPAAAEIYYISNYWELEITSTQYTTSNTYPDHYFMITGMTFLEKDQDDPLGTFYTYDIQGEFNGNGRSWASTVDQRMENGRFSMKISFIVK